MRKRLGVTNPTALARVYRHQIFFWVEAGAPKGDPPSQKPEVLLFYRDSKNTSHIMEADPLMLDEVGAAYWFDQTASSHEMVIAGANAEYPLHGTDLVVRGEADFIDGVTGWAIRSEHPPAKVMSHDFDLITPSSAPVIKQSASVLPTKGADSFEMFLWPGGSHGHPDIDPAKLFMEQMEAASIVATCTTKDPRIHAGSRVKVSPKLGDATETWLVTDVSVRA